jgi:hypothetical protein
VTLLQKLAFGWLFAVCSAVFGAVIYSISFAIWTSGDRWLWIGFVVFFGLTICSILVAGEGQ